MIVYQLPSTEYTLLSCIDSVLFFSLLRNVFQFFIHILYLVGRYLNCEHFSIGNLNLHWRFGFSFSGRHSLCRPVKLHGGYWLVDTWWVQLTFFFPFARGILCVFACEYIHRQFTSWANMILMSLLHSPHMQF